MAGRDVGHNYLRLFVAFFWDFLYLCDLSSAFAELAESESVKL